MCIRDRIYAINSYAGITSHIQVYSLPLTAIICSLCFFIVGTLFGICFQKISRLFSCKSKPASNQESLYEEVKSAHPVVTVTTSVTPPQMSENMSYMELSMNNAYNSTLSINDSDMST